VQPPRDPCHFSSFINGLLSANDLAKRGNAIHRPPLVIAPVFRVLPIQSQRASANIRQVSGTAALLEPTGWISNNGNSSYIFSRYCMYTLQGQRIGYNCQTQSFHARYAGPHTFFHPLRERQTASLPSISGSLKRGLSVLDQLRQVGSHLTRPP